MQKMRTFLVTNDDGVLSEGLLVLAQCASQFGRAVVVAPETERSGISHAITLSEPLRARKVKDDFYALSGTPADCVFIGLHHLLAGTKVDFVLSGVNRGPNLGYDVLYSGTVGGAMEGVIQGLPSLAFSLVCRGEYPFGAVAPFVLAILREVVERGIPRGILLNVNIPSPFIANFRGFKVTRLGERFYSNDVISRQDPRGGEYLWIGGTRVTMEDQQDTDCGAVKRGFVTITPVAPQVMAMWAMKELSRFESLETQEFSIKHGVRG
jgi:5'-nucleotidase